MEAGVFVTVEQGTEEHVQEQLAVLLLTRRGERPMVPLLGILDPTFDTVDPGDVQMQVELYGPDVALLSIDIVIPDDTRQEATITYA